MKKAYNEQQKQAWIPGVSPQQFFNSDSVPNQQQDRRKSAFVAAQTYEEPDSGRFAHLDLRPNEEYDSESEIQSRVVANRNPIQIQGPVSGNAINALHRQAPKASGRENSFTELQKEHESKLQKGKLFLRQKTFQASDSERQKTLEQSQSSTLIRATTLRTEPGGPQQYQQNSQYLITGHAKTKTSNIIHRNVPVTGRRHSLFELEQSGIRQKKTLQQQPSKSVFSQAESNDCIEFGDIIEIDDHQDYRQNINTGRMAIAPYVHQSSLLDNDSNSKQASNMPNYESKEDSYFFERARPQGTSQSFRTIRTSGTGKPPTTPNARYSNISLNKAPDNIFSRENNQKNETIRATCHFGLSPVLPSRSLNTSHMGGNTRNDQKKDANLTHPSRKSRLSKPNLFHTEDVSNIDGGHNYLIAPKTEQNSRKKEGLASRLSNVSSLQIEKMIDESTDSLRLESNEVNDKRLQLDQFLNEVQAGVQKTKLDRNRSAQEFNKEVLKKTGKMPELLTKNESPFILTQKSKETLQIQLRPADEIEKKFDEPNSATQKTIQLDIQPVLKKANSTQPQKINQSDIKTPGFHQKSDSLVIEETKCESVATEESQQIRTSGGLIGGFFSQAQKVSNYFFGNSSAQPSEPTTPVMKTVANDTKSQDQHQKKTLVNSGESKVKEMESPPPRQTEQTPAKSKEFQADPKLNMSPIAQKAQVVIASPLRIMTPADQVAPQRLASPKRSPQFGTDFVNTKRSNNQRFASPRREGGVANKRLTAQVNSIPTFNDNEQIVQQQIQAAKQGQQNTLGFTRVMNHGKNPSTTPTTHKNSCRFNSKLRVDTQIDVQTSPLVQKSNLIIQQQKNIQNIGGIRAASPITPGTQNLGNLLNKQQQGRTRIQQASSPTINKQPSNPTFIQKTANLIGLGGFGNSQSSQTTEQKQQPSEFNSTQDLKIPRNVNTDSAKIDGNIKQPVTVTSPLTPKLEARNKGGEITSAQQRNKEEYLIPREEYKDQKQTVSNVMIIPGGGNNLKPGSGASTTDTSNKQNSGHNSAMSPHDPTINQERYQKLKGDTVGEALEKYEDELTQFEKNEMIKLKFVYTIGSIRMSNLGQVQGKDGFYMSTAGEQINYRYQVIETLDRGAFGQVMKCIDYGYSGREVALKISKCSKSDVFNTQAEAKWLQLLELKDPQHKHNIVRMYDKFNWRLHYVIVFELLGKNLYNHIRSPNFEGMPKEQLRTIAKQILQGLQQLQNVGIIHCDLKPENVLFTDSNCTRVKIVDFGSSTDEYSSGYTYVQSRFYRSPEVTMGVPYGHAIDMWSFGCILAELDTGRALFPAHDELELLERMRITVGMPPDNMIKNASKRKQFFNSQGKLLRSSKSQLPMNLEEKSFPIKQQVYTSDDPDFIDFLEKCLTMDPEKRLTPALGLKHQWITRTKVAGVLKDLDPKMMQKGVLGDLCDVLVQDKPRNKRASLAKSRSDLGVQQKRQHDALTKNQV